VGWVRGLQVGVLLSAAVWWPGPAQGQTATYQECIEWCPGCHEFCMDHTQGAGSAAALEACADSMCPTRSADCMQTHCADHMPLGSVPAPPHLRGDLLVHVPLPPR